MFLLSAFVFFSKIGCAISNAGTIGIKIQMMPKFLLCILFKVVVPVNVCYEQPFWALVES